MQLICLSISHHNTPVELRECLSLPAEIVDSAFSQNPLRAGQFEAISEMVILSTCNRLEAYAMVAASDDALESVQAAFQPLLDYIHAVFAIPIWRVEPYLRRFSGSAAVEHLYRVAAGLDSIAIGETQILGQVSRALDTALQSGSARHVLSSLFRAAIHTGKRVHTETEIGRRPTSISTIAVQLAEETSGALDERTILVVGAGKMGGTTLEVLRDRGSRHGQVMLTSRTYSHAAEVAARYGVAVLPYENIIDGLEQADVVFTSTAAAQPILRRDMISAVMRMRSDRPLALIDLAVPRNVDPGAGEISGVTTFDMDDLQTFARSTQARNYVDISRAEGIVAEEVSEYEKLLRVIPFIGELHKKVEEIRQREVERALRHLDGADPEVTREMEMFSRSLVRKILHEPTMHLRSETDQETLSDYVSTLARLFDLGDTGPEFARKESAAWQ